MNKNMALVSGCLLLFSTQLLADRPAVSEQNTGPELQESFSPMTESAVTESETMTTETTESSSPLDAATQEEASPEETAPMEAMPPAASPVETTPAKTTMQSGDVLELQPGETLPVQTLDFPHRGMSMDSVQKELGEPIEISPAIGDPPITSWTYPDRIVYFERSLVIHAVPIR